MPQGLQIWSQTDGVTPIFDTNDRIARVIYVGTCAAGGIPNGTWVQILPADHPQATTMFGYLIPKYAVTGTDTNQQSWKMGTVSFDPVGQPGKIYVNGNWYNSQSGTVTTYPYDNSLLVIGVY